MSSQEGFGSLACKFSKQTQPSMLPQLPQPSVKFTRVPIRVFGTQEHNPRFGTLGKIWIYKVVVFLRMPFEFKSEILSFEAGDKSPGLGSRNVRGSQTGGIRAGREKRKFPAWGNRSSR
ncbi:hypothetical protein AVEN_168250-1 [Araneus ventricosus]|uniref:Uncharacterized protein n=1 Tax=Araneus ventricosus TaxID=182803 RepID=A0A4Y2WE12_ARAVE|nr:hypothetical protein AVEN_87504-1 [Araneus ventricosus]GBO34806.1 hypothetical protein AVEN_168250-1 [Araneus ventricosus]